MHKFSTAVVLLACLFLLMLNASGQTEQALINITERNINDGLSDIKNRSIELERIRTEANHPRTRNEAKFPEIVADFEQIQIVNTEKIQKNAVTQTWDYGAIAKASKEINKRARRLHTNLFPEYEEAAGAGSDMAKEFADKPLNSLIISLDNAIYHFVSSPIFQNLQVVNPADSAEAEKDLETIIILSEIINKKAAELK